MIMHADYSETDVRILIRLGRIRWAGSLRDKIYGRLSCRSGKRIKRENRIFFESEEEAIGAGFRPCGHCMRLHYLRWRSGRGL